MVLDRSLSWFIFVKVLTLINIRLAKIELAMRSSMRVKPEEGREVRSEK